MEIILQKASQEDAKNIWKMQKESFYELLLKYKDYDTNPGNEPLSKIEYRISDESHYMYLINAGGEFVGGICIKLMPDNIERRISPLFILPEFRNRGYAQAAILEAERIHGVSNWALETILEEKGNCYLYEKMGYRDTGCRMRINEKMTLILYAK